jgi:hypothetical protein
MRTIISLFFITALCWTSHPAKAADILTPGFLKVSLYTNITGTAVADLTGDPNYPAKPGEVRFLKSFNTRDALPTDAFETFGGRIEGFLTPLESADYHFFLRSDDASELWLGTDETEATAAVIAQELDSGDAFQEPDTGDAATSPPVTLTAGKRYFIMVLYKSSALAGNSTDYAQVAWRKVGDTTPAGSLKPIPGAFLSALATDSAGPKITITQPPANVTAEENSRFTFTVAATTTPTNYVSIQWQRNGVNIPGATGTNYTRFLDKADNGAKFRAVVAVPGASSNSAEATATVTDDKTPPVLAGAKGGPNRPEVTLTFSERVNQTSATALANYRIATAGGTALAVTEAALSADRTQVTLKTAAQAIGTEYTVTVNNVADLAATAANVVAANSSTKFFTRGPLFQGEDGFVVWEAEDYDRNLDDLWVATTERGVASGGVSMVNNNGAGGNENNTKLEYDVFFSKAGTNIIWYRFSGNDGNDDSSWIHVDGARPVGREAGNLAALSGTGTSLAANWGWTASPFEGGGQMTFVIDTPGVHSIAIARREDGSFVDKFVITKDSGFNPTTAFGALGPAPTLRQGEPLPAGTDFQITRHPASTNGLENTALTLSAATAIPPGFLFSHQWQRKEANAFVDIAGATSTNLTRNPLTVDWNGTVVRLKVIVAGLVKYSDEATITVTPETTPPELVRATGLALKPEVVIVFSEPVTAATAQNIANYKIDGAAGSVAVTSAALSPNARTVVLVTGPQTVGTKYTVTVNGVADTAAKANVMANAQTKFYSLGQLQPQDANGLLVFEAEAYDRNLDDLWRVDTARGAPSGGVSVVLPNGAGGTEAASQLEYDLNFTKTGNHIIWYRASGNDGSDDSAFLWIDGARPPNRTAGNTAGMSGFGNQLDFVWRSSPVEGGGQMTFDIATAGVHVMGLARREDGSFFDKFAISSDLTFNPGNYGVFGPPETRVGAAPLPTLAISSPATNAQFNAGVDIPLTVAVSPTTRTITKVEFFRGTAKIGESVASPYTFTWQNAPTGTNSITARLTDDVNDVVQSRAVPIIVSTPQGVSITATLGTGGLTITLQGGTGPFTIQKKNSLADAAWQDLQTTSETTVTIPIAGSTAFFRIKTP